MNLEEDFFKRYCPDFKKLEKYGFLKNKNNYFLEKSFMQNSFTAKINITKSGKITGKIYDTDNNEEYLLLRLENPEGVFVGKVKSEYEKILTDIRDKCFTQKFFITEQANRIYESIHKKYGDSPVFMWEKYPTFGVFKDRDTNKWYGLIMYISRSKLGEPTEKMAEVINLKLDKDKIPVLIKKDGYYPAYHMNKKYWITVSLDETLDDKEIMTLVEESRNFAINKKQKKQISP